MNKSSNSYRIAFIHHPFSAEFALLESMPIGLNVVQALDNAGHEVDLFIWEKNPSVYEKRFSSNVRVRQFGSGQPKRVIKRKLDWLNYLNQPFAHVDGLRHKNYDCVFGLGQIGLWLASLLARHSNAAYFYINDEFPSSYGLPHNSYWNRMERKAAAGASVIIVPDEQRAKPLYKELELEISTVPYAVIPNVIAAQEIDEDIDWKSRLGINTDSIPLLHAGSVADWAQVPEILASVPYWPEQTVMIINGRTPVGHSYKQELGHLLVKDRVFWTEQPLRESELNSLVRSSAASFALYRDLGENIRTIGWSAGKLLRSIACGRPVIASRYPSLAFIEEFELGRLVTHPAEIPAAITSLLNDQQRYESNCTAYTDTHLAADKWWPHVVERIKKATGIALA